MEIDCGVCRLRAWRAGDEASLLRHANNRAIWLQLRDRFPHPYTPEDARWWVQFASAQQPVTSLAIELQGEAVGNIGIEVRQDVERCSAEMGYWLGESVWGRGVATAAVRAATAYAFSTFGLTRVYAIPYARNMASRRVLEKTGFQLEGVMRRAAIKDGEVLDTLLYAITDLDIGKADGGDR
jgi:RimJ/RimL family protein N-acetyltransferase